MLEQCSNTERWNGVNEIVERWLHSRQAMIVQLCDLSGVNESSPATATMSQRLESFCQILVDYVSSGHFEVYYELLREAEAFADGSAELAKRLLPGISQSTEAAMAFNDQYSVAVSPFEQISKHLSTLSETLATRFELEDRLINSLHIAHREQVA